MAAIDLYTRLSILRDGSDSLERQLRDLTDAAERHGHTIRRVWSDGASGYKKSAKRPDFEKAIDALTSGTVEQLWVWKLDRLSRQGAGKVGTILDKLEEVGGRIVFLLDGYNSSDHRQMILFASEQARTESTNTALRVTKKNESLISQGFPVAGKRRYGFLGALEAECKKSNVEPHPDEAPDVQTIFGDYLTGSSIRSLAIQRGWNNNRVRGILSNPAYAGWVVRKGEVYPAHESITRLVTQEQFDSVKIKLANNPVPKGGGVVRHLATGIAQCGVCDRPMIFRNGYMCIHDLSHPWIKEEILDTAIRRAVAKRFADPDFTTTPGDPNAQTMKEARAELAELEAKIGDVLSGLSAGLKMAQLVPYLRPLQDRQVVVQRRVEALLEESVQERLLDHIRETVKRHLGSYPQGSWPSPMMQEVPIKWAWNKLPLDQQRELVRGMFTIRVHPGRGAGRVSIAPRETRRISSRNIGGD